MPLALRKQAAVALADGSQGSGKGEGVQRLAGCHSRFMTVPRAAIPNCTLNVQLEGMSRKRDNRKKTTRFWQGWGDVPKVCATVGTWGELMEMLRQALQDGKAVDWGKAILTLSKGQVYEPSAQELMAANSPNSN